MSYIKGKKIHFIGTGGTSMSALLELCAYLGATVSGSDKENNNKLKNLKEKGYDVYCGSNTSYPKNADITVYSGAVLNSDVEVKAARRAIERGAFLGIFCAEFDKCIAVAGTHGKTTISAMITHVLKKINYQFCSHFGGESINCDSPVALGKKLIVTEACEYRDSFLSIKADHAIISNIEYDHPDYFVDKAQMLESYRKFANNVGSSLILGANAAACIDAHVRTYCEGRDFVIKRFNVQKCAFVLSLNGEDVAFYLPTISKNDMLDAAYAALVLKEIGIPVSITSEALESFEGVKRRMECIGRLKGRYVYTDYAHHPSQIYAAIENCKQKYGDVITVFQPHTYSRTKALMSDFAKALATADKLLLMDVYGARENYIEDGSSSTLFSRINSNQKYAVRTKQEILSLIDFNDGGALLFLGAGDIDDMARQIVGSGGF